MDSKTVATGLAGLATNVAWLVIPEVLPADPSTKAVVLNALLVVTIALYLLAAAFWWRGRKVSDAEKAARLCKGISELITSYKDNSPSGEEWSCQTIATKQYEVASKRLLERYRTAHQAEVIAFLRRLKKKGRDVGSLIQTAQYQLIRSASKNSHVN